MIDHIVTARSMKEIREIVKEIKKAFEFENLLKFPLMKFYEHVLPDLFPDYRFIYVNRDEMNGEEAYTDHIKKEVRIRVDVYKRALKGIPGDIFTIAHEIGHLFLHQGENIAFSRTRVRFPAYRSAEWQANYFAAELLMSSELILDLSEEEISEKCGVSLKAASIQLDHAKNESIKGKL